MGDVSLRLVMAAGRLGIGKRELFEDYYIEEFLRLLEGPSSETGEAELIRAEDW